MSARDDRAERRRRIDDLLREIDAKRRQQLLLEAAGAFAPGLEQEARPRREQLAELVRSSDRPWSRSSARACSDFSSSRPIPARMRSVFVNWISSYCTI